MDREWKKIRIVATGLSYKAAMIIIKCIHIYEIDNDL